MGTATSTRDSGSSAVATITLWAGLTIVSVGFSAHIYTIHHIPGSFAVAVSAFTSLLLLSALANAWLRVAVGRRILD